MHTAEHILNQTMVRMFGCPRSRNAHIERKKSKCDYLLAQAPTEEQIRQIETAVNEIIASALPVTTEFMPKEEAGKFVDLSKLPPDASPTFANRENRRLRHLRLLGSPCGKHLADSAV